MCATKLSEWAALSLSRMNNYMQCASGQIGLDCFCVISSGHLYRAASSNNIEVFASTMPLWDWRVGKTWLDSDKIILLSLAELGVAHFTHEFTLWPILLLCSLTGPPLWASGQSSWLHNGDVLCFLWGTNWIYICYIGESRPPLWSSGQSSWPQDGGVMCFLWGTNWIYICYVEESKPPLCLVVRVPKYRSRGPGSIPGSTRFSEKQLVWNGVHSASWVQLRS
jgi:hypothetical protein